MGDGIHVKKSLRTVHGRNESNRREEEKGREGKSWGSWRDRWVLRRERKRSSEGQVQMEKGREYQMVGAAKEKERLPISEFILGTLSSF